MHVWNTTSSINIRREEKKTKNSTRRDKKRRIRTDE
jgi:hypothetical protein